MYMYDVYVHVIYICMHTLQAQWKVQQRLMTFNLNELLQRLGVIQLTYIYTNMQVCSHIHMCTYINDL